MENSDNSILKIYASTTDRIGSKLLYELIVEMARDKSISGVTVYRGIMGYGLSSGISTARFWELTEKLPVMIEIIDRTDRLDDFFTLIEPELMKMKKGCLVVLEPVVIKLYKSGKRVS
jgi:PII-like signaling protein